jgi:hypothetical protein
MFPVSLNLAPAPSPTAAPATAVPATATSAAATSTARKRRHAAARRSGSESVGPVEAATATDKAAAASPIRPDTVSGSPATVVVPVGLIITHPNTGTVIVSVTAAGRDGTAGEHRRG